MSKLGKRLSNFWKERKIRNYNAEKVIKFIVHISENIKKITEQHKKDIEKFTGQIEGITKQGTQQNEELITQNKKQNEELILQSRRQNKDLTNQFLLKSEKQISDFTKRFSHQIKVEQDKFLEQILAKNNAQFSEFIERLIIKNNKQNSILIKQNTHLIEQILSQSLENHGAINKKFKELVAYQVLVAFREDLITIKTSMASLENLEKIKLKIIYKIYLKYHSQHSDVPLLDITRGMIIIKIPFPVFFKQMLKNLLSLKSQFDEKTYNKMTNTINYCDYFFKNFDENPERMLRNKKMLNSDIDVVNIRLAELIKIN